MTLLDKEGVKRVEKSLKEFDPKQNVIILKSSARTASEAASSLDCEVGAIVKSLLFKTEKTFTLCLIAGDKKASLSKIKKELNIKDSEMASAEEVKDITGFTIGGVAPIGHIKKINILIDNSLQRFNSLFAAAGHPNCVFKTNFVDLEKITNGSIKEIIE
jgi:prolyl-tRNA editing enzyme YbaK/EbsC (Cys-tRNA(Pro) deacylase)